jgi:hypothetical protein
MSRLAAITIVARDKYWLIYVYVIASVVLTVGMVFRGDIWNALCLGGTSLLSLVAAGGLKFGILWGDKAQKIGVLLVAFALLVLAYWLSSGFSVEVFGYQVSGLMWGAAGASIGLLCVDRRMASQSRPSNVQDRGKLGLSVSELQEKAQKGDPEAQYRLANAYYLARNPSEGARWLLKSAEQGHVRAQCDLGVMYQKGFGVDQSYEDCLKWYRMAANHGDALGQHNLGSLNAKGFRLKGVGFFDRTGFAFTKATQDFVEAYKWFSLAGARGLSRSLKDRAIIKRRMSPAQIAKAERLVQEYETVLPAQLRNARMVSSAQDVVAPSPPLPQRSSTASPGASRTLADVARRQLAFNKAGKAFIGPDDLLPVIARYTNVAQWILDISEEEATRRTERGDGGRFALESLVRTLKDTPTYPEVSYYAKFHTDEDGEIDSIHHGWCFDSFAVIGGHEVNVLQGLRFADTIDGVLSAFFASAILPTIGAYWHGLYDRDYQMVETPKQLNELIFNGTLKETDGDTQAILRTPLGLRIQKVDGSKRCTCLCYSETEGLLDIECTISADGQASEAVRTVLREPEGRTLY